MKSIEWIDRLITEKKLPSDRQAALMIGMSSALMSQHRRGRNATLDDAFAYKLEELLGLPHGKIVLDQHAEREKDPNISAMWRKLASTAAIFLLFSMGYIYPSVSSRESVPVNHWVAGSSPAGGAKSRRRGKRTLRLLLSKLLTKAFYVTRGRPQVLGREVRVSQNHLHTCPAA